LRRIGIVAILTAAAVATAVVGGSTGSATVATVATVDGVAISREAYDEYSRVFTAPDGILRVSPEDVLLSLVNQVLVQSEADRRGLTVADQEVSGAVEEMHQHEREALSLPGVGDDAAFRERVRMFLLFGLVKSEVVGPIEVPLDVLEAEYAADSSLHILGFSDAVPVLQERLISQESDRRWVNWLGSQRACADIRILDASFDIPFSTPGRGCGAATDG